MNWVAIIPWQKLVPKLYRLLFATKDGRTRARLILAIASAGVVFALYLYCLSWIDPSRAVRRGVTDFFGEDTYTFQSASKSGFYFKVGEKLAESLVEKPKLRNNSNDGGSTEIISKVLEGNSLALIQEDVLREENVGEGQLNEITPIYSERVHVLYNVARFTELTGGSGETRPAISLEPSAITRDFFSKAVVRIASKPAKRGELRVGQRVLRLAGLKVKQELTDVPMDRTLERLQGMGPTLDVAFITAATPLDSIAEVVSGPDAKIRIMNVSLTMVAELIRVFEVGYQPSSLSYDNNESITTVASRALLVASPDVPNPIIRRVLEELKRLQGNREVIDANDEFSQLKEYSLDAQIASYPGALKEGALAWAMTLMFFVFGYIVVSYPLIWLVASAKQVSDFARMTDAYRDALPPPAKHDQSSRVPVLEKTEVNAGVLRGIIVGISQLHDVELEVISYLSTGAYQASHLRDVLGGLELIKSRLKAELAQQLDKALRDRFEYTEDEIRRFYTAGYLERDDCRHLCRLARGKPGSEPAVHDRYGGTAAPGPRSSEGNDPIAGLALPGGEGEGTSSGA